MVCRLNDWHDDVKALELATSLRGTARSVLTDLKPHQLNHYVELKHALKFRFEPKANRNVSSPDEWSVP